MTRCRHNDAISHLRLVDEEDRVRDAVERHEDTDLDGPARTEASPRDRVSLRHHDQHQQEDEDAASLHHASCK